MLKNILVAYNGRQGSQVAFRFAAELAQAAQARLHLAYIETWKASVEMPLYVDDVPVSAEISRVVQEESMAGTAADEMQAALESEIFSSVARQCMEEGLYCHFIYQHGDPVERLSQLARTANLLVLGKHDEPPAIGAPPLGRVPRRLAFRMPAPILLTALEYYPFNSLTLYYEPTPAGGRALSLAGEIAHWRNLTLNLLVAGHNDISSSAALEEAQIALRAYHVEGDWLLIEDKEPGGLYRALLPWNDPLVVLPAPPRRLFGRPLEPLRPLLNQLTLHVLLVP